jgi:hypothetical protein
MIPPGALAGLLLAVLLPVCFLSPVAVGLSIADGHGPARENERNERLGRMALDGHVSVDPGEGFDDAGMFGPYEGGPFDGEPDTHVYAFEGDHRSSKSHQNNFPRSSHVALVLRGAIMRNSHHKDEACAWGHIKNESGDTLEDGTSNIYLDTHALREQEKATKSLVENVIVPLEQAGNTVDVIVTNHDNCPWIYHVAAWIGDSVEHPRVKLVSIQPMDESHVDQKGNVLFVLDTLANYSGGKRNVAAEYTYVFIMRHDTVWEKTMSEWPEADFSKVVFPYKCPRNGGVHDLFTIMPSSYFVPYYNMVDQSGTTGCFQGNDGHQCLKAMVGWRGENSVSVAIADQKTKSEPYDFWHTYGHPRQVC